MTNNTAIWFLPKILDRQYSFIEILDSMLLGKTYIDHNKVVRLKPYAIYRCFDFDGISRKNPYTASTPEGSMLYLAYEQHRYERNGISLKSLEAYRLFLGRFKNKMLANKTHKRIKNELQK